MSLYLGRGSDNVPLLHITSGQDTKTDMQSPTAIPSTCFHSSMEYLTYIEFSPNVTAGTLTYDGFTGSLLYTQDIDGYFVYFDVDLRSEVIGGNKLFFVNVDNNLIANGNPLLTDYAFMYFTANTSKGANKSNYIDESHPYMFIPISSLTSCKILVLNVGIDSGYLSPTTDNAAGIRVVNGALMVRGIDLLRFKYISNITINGVDTIVNTVGGALQLINSNTGTSGPVGLYSTSAEAKITNNGVTIFTSMYSAAKLLYKSTIRTVLPAISLSGGTVKNVLLTSDVSARLVGCFANPTGGNLPCLPVYYDGNDTIVTLHYGNVLGTPLILSFVFSSSGIHYRYDLSNIPSGTTISFNPITTLLVTFE